MATPIAEIKKQVAQQGCCYLIKCGPFVKIGYSTFGGVKQRYADLQIGCPDPLFLLNVIPGGKKVENSLHKQFSHLRYRGEWFTDHEEIRSAFKPKTTTREQTNV